jgi:hypothetical protein
MPRTSSQILELAKRGAEYRYRELSEELSSLVRQFPHLRTLSARRRRGATLDGIEVPQPKSTPVRRRRRMSAAGRAAISAAQKKRWAAIKKMKGRSES